MEADGRFDRPGGRAPELVLEGDTMTFSPATLPGHRLLRLTLRNAGPEAVRLHARDIELLDDAGAPLRASTGFGRNRDATTGAAMVSPGATLSLDFAWRERPGLGIPSCLRVRDARVRLLPVHALHDVGERDRLA
jgi:hypothetical protein